MYNLCHFAGQQQWCGQFFPDNGARLNHAGGQVLTDFGAHDCSAFCSAFVQRTFQEARYSGGFDPEPTVIYKEAHAAGVQCLAHVDRDHILIVVSIMIFKSLSYKCPDAKQKMFKTSSSSPSFVSSFLVPV